MAIYFKKKGLLPVDGLTWTTGSGGFSGYGQNGNTVENERVVDTDPFGNYSVVWETRASGNGNDDGGWNSDTISIDRTKLSPNAQAAYDKRKEETTGKQM